MRKRLVMPILFLAFLTGTVCLSLSPSVGQEGSYVREALQGAIFIYPAASKPCDPPPPNTALLPLGSGFIVGLPLKGAKAQTTGRTEMYKFLVTAQHVVGNQDSLLVRLNRTDKPEFACHRVSLVRSGRDQNVFASKQQSVDLIAISIPDFPNTDPTVFDYSLILDEVLMKEQEVREGTDVFAVGYLFGYSGNKQNFPVAKFGKIAMLTNEVWYRSQPPRNLDEEAYLVELQNVPGLSGAPVMLQSPQFRIDKEGKFQYRRITPLIVGVIKGLLRSPTGGTQGVAAIEPAYHLRELLKKIADDLKASGIDVELQSPTVRKQ